MESREPLPPPARTPARRPTLSTTPSSTLWPPPSPSTPPDVLAVQEVGDPETLEDLASRLEGSWNTALADPDGRGIRVGFLAQSALTKVEQITDFPGQLGPVQVDDEGSTITAMGRPALTTRIRKAGTTIDLISTHLKSKLLTYPGGRFSPRDA